MVVLSVGWRFRASDDPLEEDTASPGVEEKNLGEELKCLEGLNWRHDRVSGERRSLRELGNRRLEENSA